MKEKNKELLYILQKECVTSTGCTEPISVAYAVAKAAELAEGESIQTIQVDVDEGLFKNGVAAGIPGIEERGLKIAAALGAVVKNTKNQLRLLENVTKKQLDIARKIVQEDRVDLRINEEYAGLYLAVMLKTEIDQVSVLIVDHHQNIVSIKRGSRLKSMKKESEKAPQLIQKYNLSDLIEFAKEVCLSDIEFLEEGIHMVKAISEIGQQIENGFGQAMKKMTAGCNKQDSLIRQVQMLSGAASEARMSGVPCPVMTSAGSGNHGITIFMTNTVVAEAYGCTREELLRAIVLSNLITVYIKSFTGTLSAMCGCAVAAGVGATAGVAFLLGGGEKEVFGVMTNMVGSFAGIICDGAKEGCAYKVALASGWAVQSALLFFNMSKICSDSGILASNIRDLSINLSNVCNVGMADVNHTVNSIIQKNINKVG